jgi:hypothetical protein
MKRAVFLIAAASLLASAQSAETPYMNEGGYAIGRYWTVMGPAHKLAYVIGYREAIAALAYAEIPKEKQADVLKRMGGTGITNGEMRSAIDHFYADALNLRIPIWTAVMIVIEQANGLPPELTDSDIRNARREAANAK